MRVNRRPTTATTPANSLSWTRFSERCISRPTAGPRNTASTTPNRPAIYVNSLGLFTPTAGTRPRNTCILRHWRQNNAMPSVQIKDVPEDVHRVLRERAARAHQSLQEYLRSRLIAEAKQPTLEEVLDRVAARRGGRVSFGAAVDHVRAERDRR